MAQSLTVLIAEDERDLLDLYTLKFTKEGFTVIGAQDGVQVMEELNTGTKPDVILLDLLMPRMSGYEVLSALRKDPRHEAIPVFVLSNLSQNHEIQQAIDLQADKYFVKAHYTPEQIVDKVRSYFKK